MHMVDYTDSFSTPTWRSNHQTVSKATEDESGCSHPQSKHEGYVDMVDYTDSFSTPTERSNTIPIREIVGLR